MEEYGIIIYARSWDGTLSKGYSSILPKQEAIEAFNRYVCIENWPLIALTRNGRVIMRKSLSKRDVTCETIL